MLRLASVFRHFLELAACGRGEGQLDPVDGLCLKCGIHIAVRHRHRSGPDSPDGFLPDRRRRRSNAETRKVGWFTDWFVCNHLAEALDPHE